MSPTSIDEYDKYQDVGINLKRYLLQERKDARFSYERKAGKLMPEEFGFCQGSTSIWGYACWLSEQPKENPSQERDDLEYWDKCIETIGGWDGKSALEQKDKDIFERFLSLIEAYQSPETFINGRYQHLQTIFSSTKHDVTEEYSLAGLFNRDPDHLSKLLLEIVKPGRFIMLGTCDHVMGLYLDKEGNYRFFNSASHPSMMKFEKIEDVCKAINTDLDKFYKTNKIAALTFNVFKFDNKTAPQNSAPVTYPTQADLLERFAEPPEATITVPHYAGKVELEGGIHVAAEVGCVASMKYYLTKRPALAMQASPSGSLPLHFACVDAHFEAVRSLLTHLPEPKTPEEIAQQAAYYSAMVNYPDQKGQTPAFHAARRNIPEMLNLLIAKGASLDAKTPDGRTLLMSAATRQNNVAIIELLLQHKLDVNAVDSAGNTALLYAATEGNMEIMKILHKHHAKADVVNKYQVNALMLAASSDDVGALSFLLDQGLDIEAINFKGQTALMYAAMHSQAMNCEFLLNKGAKLDAVDADGNTVLLHAANGELAAVEHLVERGADINAVNHAGETALMRAISTGYPTVVEFLLSKNPDLTVINKQGKTALMLAIEKEDLEVVHNLLKQGAVLDNETVISYALKCNKTELAAELLTLEPSLLNAVDKDGNTALMHAIQQGVDFQVAFLLENGADFNKENNKGEKPWVWAIKYGHPNGLQLLIDKGVVLLKELNKEADAIMLAVRYNRVNILSNIVRMGFNLDYTNEDGDTALMLAIRKADVSAAKILIDNIKNVSEEVMQAFFLTAECGQIEILNLLLQKAKEIKQPIDLKKCNDENQNLLMVAAEFGQFDMVASLLNAKILDIDAVNCVGDTALMLALLEKHTQVAMLLLGRGANIKLANSEGETVLMRTIKIQPELFNMVIQKDFGDINVVNLYRETALIIAINANQTNIAKWLLQKGADPFITHSVSTLTAAAEKNNVEIMQLLLYKQGIPAPMLTQQYVVTYMALEKLLAKDKKPLPATSFGFMSFSPQAQIDPKIFAAARLMKEAMLGTKDMASLKDIAGVNSPELRAIYESMQKLPLPVAAAKNPPKP